MTISAFLPELEQLRQAARRRFSPRQSRTLPLTPTVPRDVRLSPHLTLDLGDQIQYAGRKIDRNLKQSQRRRRRLR